MAGTYKEPTNDLNTFKLSADGLFVQGSDKKDENKEEVDNEVEIAKQVLKEELEKSKLSKEQ